MKLNYINKKTINFYFSDDKSYSDININKIFHYDRIIILGDQKLKNQINKMIKNTSLKKKKCLKYFYKCSEKIKEAKFAEKYIKLFKEINLSIFDHVIVVGGGTIIDVIAYTTSIFKRGITYSVVPTTLMSQVDVVSGGKTCINFLNTKNLLGTFHYPTISYLNSNFLITEHPINKRQGMSEIFKYALLNSKKLLNLILKEDEVNKKILEETIQARYRIRQIHSLASNLGHTFGHALEKYYNHKILHGDAISAGIVISLYFLLFKKKIKKKFVLEIISLMKKLGLNIFVEEKIDYKILIELMKLDKKSRFNIINLVVLTNYHKIYFNKKNLPFFETNEKELNKFFIFFKKKYIFQTKNIYKKLNSKKISY